MVSQKKSVAVITSSPALSSIISMVLGREEALRTQQFKGIDSLVSHMRILPVDLIVSDYKLENRTAPGLVAMLRKTLPRRRYQLIVLSDHMDREVKLSCRFAGVDEVIIKPMSPLFLKERVVARLETGESQTSANWRTPHASCSHPSKDTVAYSGNVIPLFGTSNNPDQRSGDSLHPA